MIKTFPQLIGSVGARPSTVGPAYYGAAIDAMKLDYAYLGMGTDNLSEFFTTVKAMNFHGFSLTMPFKEQIIPLLDGLTADAKKIGACNCVLNEDGKWIGHNTDWRGAMDALAEIGITQPAGKALIIGSGGVARAIAYGLKQQGWPVYVTNRNAARAEMLVATQGLNGMVNWAEAANESYGLVVNCTPVAEVADFVDSKVFSKGGAFLNVVFSPKETALDKEAGAHGAKIAYGWRMLLFQAGHIFKLYTGQTAPLDVMGAALAEKLE